MKIFKRLISILVIFCILISFSACGRFKKDTSVYWLLSSSIKNLDPQILSGESETLIAKNCFSTLMVKNEDGEIAYGDAEAYGVSKSGKTYVFKLKKDLEWAKFENKKVSSYAPLTAKDYMFAIRRIFTDNPDAPIMKTLKLIKNADKVLEGADASKLSVKCDDDYTLTITLSEKNDSFIDVFTSHYLSPCNEQFFKSCKGRYGLSNSELIYSGAFVISSMGESSIKLLPNKFYTNQKVNPDGITLYNPKESRDIVSLLSEGSIDAADLSPALYDSLQNVQNFTTQNYDSYMWAIVFNPQSEIWQNKNLRQAVLKCTDRSALTQAHLKSSERIVPASAVFDSQNYHTLTNSFNIPTYDTAASKELYSNGLLEIEKTSIYNSEILVCDEKIHKDSFSNLNQIYQRELSLYFSPTYLSQSEILKRVKENDFSCAVIPISLGGASPMSVLSLLNSSSSSSLISFEMNGFENALTNARNESEQKNAVTHLLEAEKIISDNAYLIPLYTENRYFVYSKEVSGFKKDFDGDILFYNVTK
ncbi:MAG: hypothetical protein IJO86_05825 [Oscillospiraceae bacterium]|nr:hypothetical protein [Oscillospiraceae bacterium]